MAIASMTKVVKSYDVVTYQFYMAIAMVTNIKMVIAHRNGILTRPLLFPFQFADALTKAVQDLIALVKQLREDVAHQTVEINHLRRIIENCAGCREPVPIKRENCQNANPCFEGVQCYDAEGGPRCGRCPSGETYLNSECRRPIGTNRLFCFDQRLRRRWEALQARIIVQRSTMLPVSGHQ